MALAPLLVLPRIGKSLLLLSNNGGPNLSVSIGRCPCLCCDISQNDRWLWRGYGARHVGTTRIDLEIFSTAWINGSVNHKTSNIVDMVRATNTAPGTR